jgi:hypothetical protein
MNRTWRMADALSAPADGWESIAYSELPARHSFHRISLASKPYEIIGLRSPTLLNTLSRPAFMVSDRTNDLTRESNCSLRTYFLVCRPDQMGKLLESLGGKAPESSVVETDLSLEPKPITTSPFQYTTSDAILYALGGKSNSLFQF